MVKPGLTALVCGLLFGFGLSLAEMTNRQRVLGFLDVTGNWDPTLLFVMAGAVSVTLVTFRFILKREIPLLAPRFYLPTRKDIDLSLITGAVIFGIGWGITGYCPGPVIAAMGSLTWNPFVFIIFFIGGSYSAHLLSNKSH